MITYITEHSGLPSGEGALGVHRAKIASPSLLDVSLEA